MVICINLLCVGKIKPALTTYCMLVLVFLQLWLNYYCGFIFFILHSLRKCVHVTVFYTLQKTNKHAEYFFLFILVVHHFPTILVRMVLISLLRVARSLLCQRGSSCKLNSTFYFTNKKGPCLLLWAKCFSQSAVNCWENEPPQPTALLRLWCPQRTQSTGLRTPSGGRGYYV